MTAGRKKKVIIGILVALCMTVTGCAGSVKKGTKYLEEKDYKKCRGGIPGCGRQKRRIWERLIADSDSATGNRKSMKRQRRRWKKH